MNADFKQFLFLFFSLVHTAPYIARFTHALSFSLYTYQVINCIFLLPCAAY
jgi:hypothetical protein